MSLRNKVIGWTLAGSIALATPIVTYYEGYESKVYLDPVGIPTVCYGHVVDPDTPIDTLFTKDACDDLLKKDLEIAAIGVSRCVKGFIPDHTKAAFISFTYNVGVGNFCKSTARRLLEMQKFVEACHELPKWVYAKGQKLPGLVKRRQAEMKLCLGN